MGNNNSQIPPLLSEALALFLLNVFEGLRREVDSGN